MRTRTILVIEDDPDLRDLLRDVLDADGFRVIAVGDAADALPLTADVAVDLVLLDLVMPRARLDGFGFLAEIRKCPNLVGTPLIIVSALGDTVVDAMDPATAQALRVASIVPKPFSIQDLLQKTHRILGDVDPDRDA